MYKAMSFDETVESINLSVIKDFLYYTYSGGKCIKCFKNQAKERDMYPGIYLCEDCFIKIMCMSDFLIQNPDIDI